MSKMLLKAEGISYSIGTKEILRNVSFSLEKGEVIGIAGESGSGKTTLAKIITGLVKQSSGMLTYYGKQKKRISPVQILFQNNGEIINPFRRVKAMVSDVIKIRMAEGGIKPQKDELYKKMKRIFNEVNLEENLWERKGHQLSGGEQQRVALARILAAEPELIILDEPFSAQDPESQERFLSLFQKINNDYNISMICISHDITLLKELCSRIIIIYKGEKVEEGFSSDLMNSPQHPYTKFLIRAENYDLTYDDFQSGFSEFL